MTGPAHYAEAEHLASALPSCMCDTTGCVHEQMQLARAQVHATLALAAATALREPDSGLQGPDWRAWNDVAATKGRDAAQVTA